MRAIAFCWLTLAACLTTTRADEWKPLFDGKTLEGWAPTAFAGAGDIEVTNGALVLHQGILTGVNYTNTPPSGTYEVALEARRTMGQDFFCGLTFPVKDAHATLIIGGWGGGVTGISSLDGEDAAHNETTGYHRFKTGQWYRIRLSVSPEHLSAWLDDEQIVNVDIKGVRMGMREGDIELSKPFGVASWSTTAEIRNIRLKAAQPPTAQPPPSKRAAGPVPEGPAAAAPAGLADTAARLVGMATNDAAVWPRMALLCDSFGPRVTGGANLEAAIEWILERMREDGLENVRGEPVTVPHWVRGREDAELVSPRAEPLVMLGLGGSIGTPPEGITAPVLVVTNFQELSARAAEAKDRIVLFNVPFTGYGETVAYRSRGPGAAAACGAKAALVRSVTPTSLRSPHTGQTSTNGTNRIPAAAISVEDAERLARWQARGTTPVVRLFMEAKTEPPAASRNVVAEWRGRDKPDEVVVVGGHIDSWDVGQGAQDDGGNCVAAWEALRLLKDLNTRPRRTVRVVLWTGEENSGAGGQAYAEAHRAELPLHVAALESDSGVYPPAGLDATAGSAAWPILRGVAGLLGRSMDAGELAGPEGEADLTSLRAAGVPTLGLRLKPNNYFWYHHTHADTPDKVSPADLQRVTAALAVTVYALADWPDPLPR